VRLIDVRLNNVSQSSEKYPRTLRRAFPPVRAFRANRDRQLGRVNPEVTGV
jgi:hypothetical protein